MGILRRVFFSADKEWVIKIDLLILAVWLLWSHLLGLCFWDTVRFISPFALVIVLFQIIVARLIPRLGFWYHHGND